MCLTNGVKLLSLQNSASGDVLKLKTNNLLAAEFMIREKCRKAWELAIVSVNVTEEKTRPTLSDFKAVCP